MATVLDRRGVDPRHLRSVLATVAGALNVVLGLWLVVSAPLLDHRAGPRHTTMVLGALVAVLAAVRFRRDELRFVVAGVAILLGFTAGGVWALSGAALWNQLLVAFAIFALALLPALRPVDEQP